MTFERNVKGLLGTKLGMTQVWDENNRVVPVTVIDAEHQRGDPGPHPRRPTATTPSRSGFGEIDGRKVNKPQAGHFDQGRHHAAPPRRRDPHRPRDRLHRRPGAARRHLRRWRGDRRDRHQQGQGLRRCHEAARLPRRLRLARCAPQPPQAGLDRRLRHPRSRVQGHPHGRPDGYRHRHHPEHHRARRRRREGPDPAQGCRSRPQGWTRGPPLGRQEDRRRSEHGYH